MQIAKKIQGRKSTKPAAKPAVKKRPVAARIPAKKAAPRTPAKQKKTPAKRPSRTPEKGSQAESMLRIREARIKKYELVNAKMLRDAEAAGGDSLPRGAVEEEIQSANAIIRSQSTVLGRTLPQRLVGLSEKEMQPVIDRVVEQMFNNLCETLSEQPP